jgi:hypothetical protein
VGDKIKINWGLGKNKVKKFDVFLQPGKAVTLQPQLAVAIGWFGTAP